MSDLKDYAVLGLLIDGSIQLEITSLSCSTDPNNIQVDLIKNLGGWTPGPGRETIDIGYAVPVGGQEFDFKSASAKRTWHHVQIPIGGKTYTGRGKFHVTTIGQSASASTEGTTQFIGPLKPLQ